MHMYSRACRLYCTLCVLSQQMLWLKFFRIRCLTRSLRLVAELKVGYFEIFHTKHMQREASLFVRCINATTYLGFTV